MDEYKVECSRRTNNGTIKEMAKFFNNKDEANKWIFECREIALNEYDERLSYTLYDKYGNVLEHCYVNQIFYS